MVLRLQTSGNLYDSQRLRLIAPKKGYLGLELNDKHLHIDGWLGGKAIDEYKRFCHEVDKRFVNDGLSFHVRQSTTFVDKDG